MLAKCVNSDISVELASITYSQVDDVVESIKYGSLLIKMDLESVYRHIPIHPDDHHFLGISWQGHTFIDRALPFGL